MSNPDLRWARHVDVVVDYAGWADDELYAGWVRQTRVIRGLAADPVTGETRAAPDFNASRGECVSRVRELINAVAQAYRAIDIPAPADPDFARIYLGAFRGVSSFRPYLPTEGAELPEPQPRYEEAVTAGERETLRSRYESRETARRLAAVRRTWDPVLANVRYVSANGAPAEVTFRRAGITWDGNVFLGGLAESADAWLQQHADEDARAHRHAWPRGAGGWQAAPSPAQAAPWRGTDLFIHHQCDRRQLGNCQWWHAYVLPSPAMEWELWCEIADALERRSAQDILRDVWRYTAARNVAELRANNMATSEVEDLLGQADLDVAKIQQENDLRTAAKWIDTVSSFAMAAGPYGAIVGAILKGLAAILDAIPIAYGFNLDAWDRTAPAFSKTSISGQSGEEPTHAVELPPRFMRAPRGTLKILYPERDAERMRVQVNGGVWRPFGWSGELPAGVRTERRVVEYEINVEQPGRIPSRITARVWADEETVIQLHPLRKPPTARERQEQMDRENAQAEADKVLKDKQREEREATEARKRDERQRKKHANDATPEKPAPLPDATEPKVSTPGTTTPGTTTPGTTTPGTTTPGTTAPPPGAIVIEAPRGAPPGARVRVLSTDGARELLPWSTPPVSLAVAPGTYRLEWSEAGRDASTRDIAVVSLTRVAVNLWASRGRVREIARKVGTVVVAAGAAGAAVYAVRRYQRRAVSGALNPPR